MNKSIVILVFTILTGCLPEVPVKPVKIGMHSIPENEPLVIAEQQNYFPLSDVHIVEAPADMDLMPALRSGALDGVVSPLASILNWSAKGVDLTIVAVINSSNEYSFPERKVSSGSRLDSQAYNVIAVRSDFLADHPVRIGQLVSGWQRVSWQLEDGEALHTLSAEFDLNAGNFNFTSYNRNKELLIVEGADSLHTIISRRVPSGVKRPAVDGRFFDNYTKDAGRAQ